LNNIKVSNNKYSFDYLTTLLKFYSKKEYFSTEISDKIFEFINYNFKNTVFKEKINKYHVNNDLNESNDCFYKEYDNKPYLSINVKYEPIIFTLINYLNKKNKNANSFDSNKFLAINEIMNFSGNKYNEFLKLMINSELLNNLSKSLENKRNQLNEFVPEKSELNDLKSEFYKDLLLYIEFHTSLLTSCIENNVGLNTETQYQILLNL
jgi:hypothetical protein